MFDVFCHTTRPKPETKGNPNFGIDTHTAKLIAIAIHNFICAVK